MTRKLKNHGYSSKLKNFKILVGHKHFEMKTSELIKYSKTQKIHKNQKSNQIETESAVKIHTVTSSNKLKLRSQLI